jgi:hypothetical protein
LRVPPATLISLVKDARVGVHVVLFQLN